MVKKKPTENGLPYYITDAKGSTLGGYGNVLITKGIPFVKLEFHPLQTKLGRFAVSGSFEFSNLNSFAVTTSHLESYPVDVELRQAQMKAIIELLEPYENAIFLGDTNIAEDDEDECLFKAGYKDVWVNLNGEESGYTCDSKINYWTKSTMRIDRIYYKTKDPEMVSPFKIEIIGTTPVIINDIKIFPSDHFGLTARFNCLAEKLK